MLSKEARDNEGGDGGNDGTGTLVVECLTENIPVLEYYASLVLSESGFVLLPLVNSIQKNPWTHKYLSFLVDDMLYTYSQTYIRICILC